MTTDEQLLRDERPFCQRRLANLFLILALLFGILIIFISPPFSCPDENVHYLNVCSVSHGHLFPSVEDGQIGSYVTDQERDYFNTFFGHYSSYGERFTYAHVAAYSRLEASENEVFFADTLFEVNFIAYLLPAIAVAILRFLGFSLNAYNTMLLAKLANLLFFALVTRFAIKKATLFPRTMFLLALMPMTLYQGASLSYDALLLPCCFLLFAYTTKLLTAAEDYRITREDVIALGLAAAGIAASKVVYLCLFALLLAVPIKRFGSLKRYFGSIGYIIGVVAIVYLIPLLITSIITAGHGTPPSAMEIAQKEYFFSHLFEFPTIISNTKELFFDSWVDGFVGNFGWLDTPLPRIFVHLYLAVLFAVAIAEGSTIRGIKWQPRVLAVAAMLVIVLGTFAIMFLKFNPNRADYMEVSAVYGMQGRYFIPFTIFLMLTFANPLLLNLKQHKKIESAVTIALPFVAVCYLAMTVLVLLVRFWI